MDETNERLVWDLLLHTATNFSAQYLYLAPKFPRQLEYNDDMTVTFVNNGMNKIAKRGRDKGRQKGKLVHTDGIERYLNAIKKRKKGKAK